VKQGSHRSLKVRAENGADIHRRSVSGGSSAEDCWAPFFLAQNTLQHGDEYEKAV
jgi:hypothetical protein